MMRFVSDWEEPAISWGANVAGDEDDIQEDVHWDIAIPLPTSSTTTQSGQPPNVMMVKIPGGEVLWEESYMRKVEVNYTKGVEEILQKLAKPLAVVHNVAQAEVLPVLEKWRKSIQKELDAVSHAMQRLVPGQEEYSRVMNLPGLQILPMKFVFTCKPPSEAPEKEGREPTEAPPSPGAHQARGTVVFHPRLLRHEGKSSVVESFSRWRNDNLDVHGGRPVLYLEAGPD